MSINSKQILYHANTHTHTYNSAISITDVMRMFTCRRLVTISFHFVINIYTKHRHTLCDGSHS